MPRRIRLILAFATLVGLSTAMTLGFALRALRQVQPFYAAALEVESREDAGRKLESSVAALYSDAVQQSDWQAAFAETAVNGWLASAWPEKYAELLPATILEPRVAFSEGECKLGFRYQSEGLNTVLSVRIAAFVSERDELAVRILSAHAGTLPIPLTKIIQPMSELARKQQLPLRWSQIEGDPVALIPLQDILSTETERRQVDAIELHPGELVLAGKTSVKELQLGAAIGKTTR